MKVNLNGELIEVECNTLGELLQQLDYTLETVATAVDGVFVARGQRSETVIKDGMKIDIVAPMQGG